jgi:hypothetical protein
MFGAIWAAFKALSIWARIGSVVTRIATAVAGWAERNPAWGACIALALLCALFWHEWSVKARQVAQMAAAAVQMRHALDTDTTTIRDLQAAIARQNIAMMALGKASAAAQAQGAKADDAALDRSAHRDALSAGITVPTTAPAQCDNRTPADVMAANGSL